MLIVLIHNISPPLTKPCVYEVKVMVNRRTIWQGKVHDHNRDDGWPALMRMIADEAETVIPRNDKTEE